MKEHSLDPMQTCRICPRACGVNRYVTHGFCGASTKLRVARVMLHPWEEPCLVGDNGAGAIFFSWCNLRCCFCQNHEISHVGKGIDVTMDRLVEIFLEQEKNGAATLDLVTPTHYAPQIAQAIRGARKQGLSIPIVYNSSGYECVETLESLNGLIDIYLPDLKYFSDETAKKYAETPNYFNQAKIAIKKMYDQVGKCFINKAGILQKGVIVRHLVLPGHRKDSMALLEWLWETFGNEIYVSLMSQYEPFYHADDHKEINRKLTSFEYESVVDFAQKIGFINCYTQGRESANKRYVPLFDGHGVV